MEMEEYIVSKKNKPKFTRNEYLLVFDKHSKKDPIISFGDVKERTIAKLVCTLRTM